MNINNHIEPIDAAMRTGSVEMKPATPERRHKKTNPEGTASLLKRHEILQTVVGRTLAAIQAENPALVRSIESPEQPIDLANQAATQLGVMVGPSVFESPYPTPQTAATVPTTAEASPIGAVAIHDNVAFLEDARRRIADSHAPDQSAIYVDNHPRQKDAA